MAGYGKIVGRVVIGAAALAFLSAGLISLYGGGAHMLGDKVAGNFDQLSKWVDWDHFTNLKNYPKLQGSIYNISDWLDVGGKLLTTKNAGSALQATAGLGSTVFGGYLAKRAALG